MDRCINFIKEGSQDVRKIPMLILGMSIISIILLTPKKTWKKLLYSQKVDTQTAVHENP